MSGCLNIIAALILALALSWGLTCGILYLVGLCFDLTFSLATATGIWLVLFLLSSFFRSNTSNKK